MKARLIIYFLAVFISLLFNSLLAEDKLQKVLVTIGDEKITKADFEKRIKLISPQHHNMLKSKKAQEDMLNRMVQTMLLAKEARSIGIDKEEEVALRIEDMVNNF